MSLSLMVINEARNLSRRFLEFFEYIGNVANGVHTIVRPHEVVDPPDAREATITQGHIRFDAVRFGYRPEAPVFDGLSVNIPASQRVGLVGLSGSGKSTFVSLLLRLYDPQGGRIEASDDEVIEAARQTHADEFIRKIKDGYASMVGERGVKLSGGQRPRVAIARVVLKNAPVLILDEATSALDSLTEQAIQDTLERVMKGKTVIVVAHRLSTIAHLDRILVFDQGCIVEDGSHTDLLARRGAYWQLWSRQAGGFLSDDPDGTPHQPPRPASRPEAD
ncbi:MAG: ATP-binding cassette domain-containing protein [Aquabacterium sp.]